MTRFLSVWEIIWEVINPINSIIFIDSCTPRNCICFECPTSLESILGKPGEKELDNKSVPFQMQDKRM
jgi:hypothetical protein